MQKEWKPLSYRSLSNRLIGICGTGSIGQRIAQTAKHFGMNVWGYRRTFEQNSAFDKIYIKNDFKEFLKEPDFIVITLPITDETFHLFDYDSFFSMKDTAVLINVGRGAVVEEKALAKALEEGLIRGAVLDVFKNEPLPKESPLWEMENVIITPHHSAIDLPEDIVKIFSTNYKLFIENKPLNYIIDLEKGY
jgi:phosphoglycerate dehydrogenase-like enzyme